MNFLIFNVILFGISYILDYMAIHIFGVVEWSEAYMYYLFVINIPVSIFLTYIAVRRLREYMGVE